MKYTTPMGVFLAASACTLAGPAAQAGDFDGSKALICAPAEVHECVAGTSCAAGSPREIGTPTFLRIDFAKKAIVGPLRTSPILHIEASEGQLLLMGTELDFGWSLALNQATGDMAATLTDRDGAFVMFGSCIAP
jgi:hypothetical protein